MPTSSMARLVQRFSRLPGIGKRSAERLAFYLLKASAEEAQELATAIVDLKRNVRHCRECFNLCESDVCSICADPRRNRSRILVVEQPGDIATIEATGQYDGLYHVLMGHIAPLDDIGPGDLNIDPLLERVGRLEPEEVILGTNPTLEGDGTALYLHELLAARNVQVSRLARGIPTGANLELVSKAVLIDAIHGRQRMNGSEVTR